MVGVLVVEHLVDEVLHRLAEVGADRRLRGEVGLQRRERWHVAVLADVDVGRLRRGHPVGLFEHLVHAGAHR